jgi:hypothetical protein
VSLGPLAWAATDLQPDESTAGPDSPHCGPRRGLGFASPPEAAPDPHLQPSPQTAIVNDQYAVYGPDRSGQ